MATRINVTTTPRLPTVSSVVQPQPGLDLMYEIVSVYVHNAHLLQTPLGGGPADRECLIIPTASPTSQKWVFWKVMKAGGMPDKLPSRDTGDSNDIFSYTTIVAHGNHPTPSGDGVIYFIQGVYVYLNEKYVDPVEDGFNLPQSAAIKPVSQGKRVQKRNFGGRTF